MDFFKIIFIRKIDFDMESLHDSRHGKQRISSSLNLLTLAADLLPEFCMKINEKINGF